MASYLVWGFFCLLYSCQKELAGENFISHLAWMTDVIGATIDAFDLGKVDPIGIGDVISIGIIPSSLAVIFLNYYKSDKKWFYAVLFSFISLAFEWGIVQVGFMKLHGWNTWWSIPVYLFVYRVFLPWHLGFIRTEVSKENAIRVRGLNMNLLRRKEKAR